MVEKDETLDCLGLLCPAPIVKLAKKMKKMESGKILELVADDEGALEDVPAWARKLKNDLLEVVTEGNVYKFYIKKS